MKTITWKPRTNREKQTIKEHGNEWEVHRFCCDKILIQSLDKKDLRWIRVEQINP